MEARTSECVNEKLKETIHYILHKCVNSKNFGKTVLFKLLYFSDFNYYKIHYKSITGESYLKLPFGPAPRNFTNAVNSLSEEGKIRVMVNETNGIYKYKVLESPKIEFLTKDEIKIIDSVIEKIGNCNAGEISRLSHKDTPWQVTNEKEVIRYDLVFYRDEEIAKKVE